LPLSHNWRGRYRPIENFARGQAILSSDGGEGTSGTTELKAEACSAMTQFHRRTLMVESLEMTKSFARSSG
jgi:hypothetical protein